MAWSLITSTSQGALGGADITTSAINTTGADLIVIGLSVGSGTFSTASVSDNYGNTWTLAKANPHFNSSGAEGSKLFYCQNPGRRLWPHVLIERSTIRIANRRCLVWIGVVTIGRYVAERE